MKLAVNQIIISVIANHKRNGLAGLRQCSSAHLQFQVTYVCHIFYLETLVL